MNRVEISRESDYDPRHYAFQRNSGTKRGDFRDIDAAIVKWRWLAIVVLIVALAVAGYTASDIASY